MRCRATVYSQASGGGTTLADAAKLIAMEAKTSCVTSSARSADPTRRRTNRYTRRYWSAVGDTLRDLIEELIVRNGTNVTRRS
jgi:hypothetical protein